MFMWLIGVNGRGGRKEERKEWKKEEKKIGTTRYINLPL